MTTETKLLFSSIELILVGLGTIISNQAILLTEAQANITAQWHERPFGEISNDTLHARFQVMELAHKNIAAITNEFHKTSKEINKIKNGAI